MQVEDKITRALEVQSELLNKRFDDLTGELGAVRDLAKQASARAASASHSLDVPAARAQRSMNPALNIDDEDRRQCRIMQAQALALYRGSGTTAMDIAVEWEDPELIGDLERNSKITSAARNGDKSALRALGSHARCNFSDFVQTTIAPTYVPSLRSRSCIRNMNPIIMPLVGDGTTIPFLKEFGGADYGKECSAPNPVELNSGSIKVKKRKLQISAYMCDEYIMDASQDVAAIIGNELRAALTEKEEQSFIRGKGAKGEMT